MRFLVLCILYYKIKNYFLLVSSLLFDLLVLAYIYSSKRPRHLLPLRQKLSFLVVLSLGMVYILMKDVFWLANRLFLNGCQNIFEQKTVFKWLSKFFWTNRQIKGQTSIFTQYLFILVDKHMYVFVQYLSIYLCKKSNIQHLSNYEHVVAKTQNSDSTDMCANFFVSLDTFLWYPGRF